MQLVHFIESLFAPLFSAPEGRNTPDANTRAFIDEAVELIVDATHPTLRLLPHYRERLAPFVQRTVDYLREIASTLPAPFSLTRADWQSDPCTNAFFATADEVTTLLRHAEELQTFFAAPGHLTLDHAHALLAMRYEEHRGFGVKLVGSVMRRDVAVRSISFSHHLLTAPGEDLAATRHAIGLRIFHTLADIAMDHILDCRAQARDLEEDRALIATRLRQARAREDGLAHLCRDHTPCPDATELQRQLDEVSSQLARSKASLTTLDDYVEAIGSVIGDPHRHLGLRTVELQIDRMGYLVSGAQDGPVNVVRCVEGEIIRKGERHPFVLAIARCRREDVGLPAT